VKILIVRIGAMGDVLHALPAVAALRAAHPDATIDWLVDDRWLPLLNDLTHTGPVVSTAFQVPTRAWKQAPRSAATIRDVLSYRNLRKTKYDLVLDMQGTLRSAALGRLAAAGAFAGYADPRESLAAQLYKTRIARRGAHVVDQGAALLSDALGIVLAPIPPAIPHEGWADDWATELVGDKRIAVLSPTAGWAAKRWPLQHFAALAQQLRDRGYTVLANTPRKDDGPANELVAASHGAASLAICNPTGLIALVRRAALFVGGDSGPMHLAAALGVPVIALFGPTDPARNGPWGSGPKTILRDPASVTSYKHTRTPDPGLARISVAQVVAALHEQAQSSKQ
jgi:heptosyltransferase-1